MITWPDYLFGGILLFLAAMALATVGYWLVVGVISLLSMVF